MKNLLCKLGWHKWKSITVAPMAFGMWSVTYMCERCGEGKTVVKG